MAEQVIVVVDNGRVKERIDCTNVPSWVAAGLRSGEAFNAEQRKAAEAEVRARRSKISDLEQEIHALKTFLAFRCITCGKGVTLEWWKHNCLCLDCRRAEGYPDEV